MPDEQLVAMLVERAQSEALQPTGQGGLQPTGQGGLLPTGQGGLLQQLTKRVLGSALEVRFLHQGGAAEACPFVSCEISPPHAHANEPRTRRSQDPPDRP
ncbi:hypothetical protein AB0945_34820 [Streptomyces sp. NPDC005474]|uniref:hypothetical protein n=1 Tax=Streptomyces sp. NPDC005474 TaxID=3154878 RepID=UPI0034564553